MLYYGLNCVPPNPPKRKVVALIPVPQNVTLFAHGVFTEVIKLKGGYEGDP